MSFENLSDVHTRGNAERIENDVDGRAVGQERHVFRGADVGNDAFIAVPAGHFIADGDFAFLSDEDATLSLDAGRKFVVVIAVEEVDSDDGAASAVRKPKAGIANLASFLAEDSAKKAFFSGEFGFALGSDFADENIAGRARSAANDEAVGIEIGKSVVGEIGNIASEFFRAEFGIASVGLIFVDVNGSEEIAFEQ